jgi:FkbM family methyltransferase
MSSVWLTENPLAIGAKAVVAALVPRRVLHEVKKRYYLWLMRRPLEALDAEKNFDGIRQLVNPGDTVVDVGAFVGYFSRMLSETVGPSGRVYSFEPVPETFDMLQYTMRHLGLTNVRLFNCALSDCSGRTQMEIPHYKNGGECLYGARIVEGGAAGGLRALPITRQTLDSVLAGSTDRVSFIKIDAEYHELQCILGAMVTIRRFRPAVMVETLERIDEPGTLSHAVVEALRPDGYRPLAFDGKFRPLAAGERTQNVFLLP